MFGKVATHLLECALVSFSCFGSVLHAQAQSPSSNVANPPPARNAQRTSLEDMVIHVNQVAYDEAAPKFAVLETSKRIPASTRFLISDAQTSEILFKGSLPRGQECKEWFPERYFYRADFSSFQRAGHFKLQLSGTENNIIPLNLKSGKMRWLRKPCRPSYNFTGISGRTRPRN